MKDPLKPVRKTFRAWRGMRRLEKEAAQYHALFRRKGLAVPDEDEISKALRTKYSGVGPVPKGRFEILAVYHDYNWENDSLRPALEKFGRVHVYDWGGKFDHGRKDWNRVLKADMNRDLLEFIRSRVREGRIDFIFTYLSGELVFPGTIETLSALRVPMVNLALNDKEAFVGKLRGGLASGARDICRHFDLCWTSTRDALPKYCVAGAVPLYLPEGANPEVHRPYDLEKTFDVAFVGQRYGNRPSVIGALASAGIRVAAFGPGWPGGALSTEDMVKMYSRSKINLGFGEVAGHRETYCLKGRDFEIPMSGGLYLTQHHSELEPFYRIGEEIVTWSDGKDLEKKVRHLLAHPEEAERIRRAGRERALRDHTWEKRFENIFTLFGLL